jgi:hypothetical protein
MGGFANEFFWRLLRDFRAWAGVCGLLIAAVSGVTGRTIGLPAWGWALIAIGCALWVAWRAERTLYEDKHAEVKCDMPLADVVARIVGSSEINHKVDETFLKLMELAHQDRLAVWGRRDVRTSDYDLYPRAQIPSSYWDEFGIDYLDYIRDKRGKTERTRSRRGLVVGEGVRMYANTNVGPDVIYSDLYFSSVQVDKIWPGPRKKLKLQSPFQRVEGN